MYRLLNMRGYSHDQIQYLNIQAPDVDPLDDRLEPEHQDYNLFNPKQELSTAFANAAAQLQAGQQFVFYLHGHANRDRASLIDDELSATQLRDLLATLPAGVRFVIVMKNSLVLIEIQRQYSWINGEW
jgi:hypothetical protein